MGNPDNAASCLLMDFNNYHHTSTDVLTSFWFILTVVLPIILRKVRTYSQDGDLLIYAQKDRNKSTVEEGLSNRFTWSHTAAKTRSQLVTDRVITALGS